MGLALGKLMIVEKGSLASSTLKDKPCDRASNAAAIPATPAPIIRRSNTSLLSFPPCGGRLGWGVVLAAPSPLPSPTLGRGGSDLSPSAFCPPSPLPSPALGRGGGDLS